MTDDLDTLEHGRRFRFADWPNPEVPHWSAGVYAIWDGERLIYVGVAGRALRPDPVPGKRRGLWDRLNSHANGRRSGDQFNVYVFDRLVLPSLSTADVRGAASGSISLDGRVRDYVRSRLSYSFITAETYVEALSIERAVQRGEMAAGRPLLNPSG